jgi:hypothetical protein
MEFNQSVFIRRGRLLPSASHWVRNMTIALVLLPIVAIARPVLAKSTSAQVAASTTNSVATHQLDQNHPPVQKPVQKVALSKPVDREASLASRATSNFRLLGYGLFLLQIGLIPLKLSKGHLFQVSTAEAPRSRR